MSHDRSLQSTNSPQMSFLKSWFSSSPESAVVAPAVTSSKATPPPSNPALVTELNPNGYKP